MKYPRLGAFALGTLLGVPGCGQDDRPVSGMATVMEAPEAWTVSAEPLFMIPGVEIDGDSIFLHIVMPGTLTREGEIAVATTQGDYQILLVDTLGRGTHVFGRSGEGPREFQRLTHVTANGDTIAAWDWVNGRVSLFAESEFVSQFSVPIPRTHVFVGMLTSGHVVSTPRTGGPGIQPSVVDVGESRPYTLISREGEEVATYFGPPDAGTAVVSVEPTRGGVPRRTSHLGTECLPETLHTTVGDEIVVADAAAGRLVAIDSAGVMRTLFETSYRALVTAEYIDRIQRSLDWVEEDVRGTAESKAELWERVGEVGDPLPVVWAELIPDQAGGAWLQRAACEPDRSTPSTWEVLGPDWSLQATVTVPGEARVLSVNDDLVLAAITPDFEIPHLALYRLER